MKVAVMSNYSGEWDTDLFGLVGFADVDPSIAPEDMIWSVVKSNPTTARFICDLTPDVRMFTDEEEYTDRNMVSIMASMKIDYMAEIRIPDHDDMLICLIEVK